MIYVLVALVGIQGYPMTSEFATQEACSEAMRWLLRYSAASTRATCTPKGMPPANATEAVRPMSGGRG